MDELSELKGRMRALRNVKKARLVNLPKLSVMVLRFAFVDVKELEMENASLLESHEVLGEVMRKKREEERRREEEERRRREEEKKKEEEKKGKRTVKREWCGKNWRWVVSYVIPGLILAIVLYSISISFIVSKLQQRITFNHLSECVGSSITKDIKELVVPSNRCNSEKMTTLDLSLFPQLKSIEIGDECFENVNEVKLIGLNQLERVMIGETSFTKAKKKNVWPDYNPNRHFYLKNCERVKELKMGCQSFKDYSVCEIENVPSLEVIEMGELNELSLNFYYASLELKSDSERMK